MSDQPPPPKPKPGSLRDRIAAFEKSAAAAAPAPAPAPRPKPAGFQSWKPKAPSPPGSPTPSADNATSSTTKSGGMSASDAKESITKGGSLKDRMAALQGKGAFGAPPVPAAKPQIEKPKWKPPPVVQAPVDEEDGEKAPSDVAAAVERTLSPPVKPQDESTTSEAPSGETAPPTESTEEGAEAVDPEEEERQRRAAIAARMARLGGARVGMAPPVFAKKPPVRRPTQESEELKQTEAPAPAPNTTAEAPTSPPVLAAEAPTSPPPVTGETTPSNETRSPEIPPVRKDSESVSILSADSADSHASRPPTSMPMAAVPRRTGPPRKKPIKATPPPPAAEEVPEVAAEGAAQPEIASTAGKSSTEEPVEEAPVAEEQGSKPAAQEAETAPLHSDVAEPLEPVTSKTDEDAGKQEEMVEPKAPTATSDQVPPSSDETTPQSTSGLSSAILSPQTDSSVLDDASGLVSPPPSLATDSNVDLGVEDVDEEGSEYSNDEPSVAPTPVPVIAHTETAPVGSEALPVVPASLPERSQSTDTIQKVGTDEEETATKAALEYAPAKADDRSVDEEEDEESEEARKKRVAERIAKMGGINPFAPQPPTATNPTSPKAPTASPPVAVAAAVPLPQSPPVEEKISIAQTVSKTEAAEEPSEESIDDESEGEDAEDISEEDRQHEHREAPPSSALTETRVEHHDSASRLPPLGHQVAAESPEDSVQDDDDQSPLADSVELPPASAPSQSSEPSSPPARPAQPPRRIIPQTPEPNYDEEQERYSEEESDGNDDMLAQSHLFIPPPTAQRSSAASGTRGMYVAEDEDDGNGSESDAPVLHYLQRRSKEISPQRTRSPLSDDDASGPESDHDGRALPIPPRQGTGPTPGSRGNIDDEDEDEDEQEEENVSCQQVTPMVSISSTGGISDDEEGDPIDPAFHSPSRNPSINNLRAASQAAELSAVTPTPTPPAAPSSPPPPPPARPTIPSPRPVQAVSSPPPQSVQQASPPLPPSIRRASQQLPAENEGGVAEEDEENARRKTIAERMARLGGIKFGAAPPALPKHRPPPPPQQEETQEEPQGEQSSEEQAAPLSEEEEERARKERIAAKMANMGGMRIGMLPMGMGSFPQQKSHVLREEDVSRPLPPPQASPPTRAVPPSRPPPPPQAAPPPPPPPAAADTDSEYSTEDGVKVEAEESEVDEVTYDDVQEEDEEEQVEEETPPPVPSRANRGPPNRQSTLDKPPVPSPTSSSFRPPVPVSMPARKASGQTVRSDSASESLATSPPTRRVPAAPVHADSYVMVDEPESQEEEEEEEEEEEAPPPPPPPPRPTSRLPPSRSSTIPKAPQPPLDSKKSTNDSAGADWELPSIPTSTLDFGEGADLSLSWTDAGESVSPVAPAAPAPPAKAPQQAPPPPPQNMSADELMMVWGRVGVQICEEATTMFEKSKKSVVGDGTYAGFVDAVFAAVPNAARTHAHGYGYGYLVYLQNGSAVQKRASDIMPGDVVEISDGKFKGHKGLQAYHQHVGGAADGEGPLVGVVGEFEAKKTKIRVFQANHHVGQHQTVESVSYRLEDLKSGVVKVYRVLEA